MSVLAMYDVRGIQSFIFKTNKVKDIIGASVLVENIICEAFCYAAKSEWKEHMEQCVITEWESVENEELQFMENEEILAQLLLIGGGNAYILYRKREDCISINKRMAKYILEKTYSLQLAVAIEEVSGNYFEDYLKVSRKMGDVKASMPLSLCLGAFPIVAVDDVTGYPLTSITRNGERISTESARKRERLPEEDEIGKKFENLITEKGEESMLAIIHIDGNSMGDMIRLKMQSLSEEDKASYAKSIACMRNISATIKRCFEESYLSMKKYLEDWIRSDANQVLDKNGVYLRKIIVAGDDITFVANAKVALSLTEFFLKDISKKQIITKKAEGKIQESAISACAGIAYIHSHFPFRIGYEIAEACCKMAKERAKEEKHKVSGEIGSWLDFQICNNVQLVNLKEYRNRYYGLADGNSLLKRPYYISHELEEIKKSKGEKKSDKESMNEINRLYDFQQFRNDFAYFQDQFPRSLVKNLRNTYPQGSQAMETLLVFAKSRGHLMPDNTLEAFDEAEFGKWYDVFEMQDLFKDMSEKKDTDI